MANTFDDHLQWHLRNHRHGVLAAVVALNPELDAVLVGLKLQCDIMCRQAVEHFEKPQSSIAFMAQSLAVRKH
jgi:hypothetical protein